MSTDPVREIKKIEVIEARFIRGAGTVEDPVRLVTQYWSFDGQLLAERDPELKARPRAKATK